MDLLNIILDGKKIGFGSSAASVVSIVGAIFEYFGKDIEKNRRKIFEISIEAHSKAQEKEGSGFDIAVSTYGGIIEYCKKNYIIKKLDFLKDLQVSVGWSGESADTLDFIKKMNEYKENNHEEYESFISKISDCIDRGLDSIRNKDSKSFIKSIKENRRLLSGLTEKSGIPIETEKLKLLADICENNDSSGKLSGAGGGDCGIAISFDKKIIEDEWRKNKIKKIDVELFAEGLRKE